MLLQIKKRLSMSIKTSKKSSKGTSKTATRKTRKVAMPVDADEIFASTRKTSDYDKFSFYNGNRDINPNHVMKLEASMQKKYLFTPITVNEKGEIIDGQHRFTAAKKLGLPIYYVVQEGYGLEEIHILNANQKNMTTNDFMVGYCNMGFDDYVIYREFKEKYNLGHRSLLTILSGGEYDKDHDHQFRNGVFKVINEELAKRYCDRILEIGNYYDGYKRRSFVSAIIKLMKKKEYVHEEFIHKLKIQPDAMYDCVKSTDYIALIERIYNYRRREEDRVRFY
jgi:hypothetical protein